MKELKFYGASDDLFECDGAIREEICMYSNPGVYHLKSSEGEMLVIACYTDEGCWAIGVGQVNKETKKSGLKALSIFQPHQGR
ncbi:TPA: hypothetical protein OUK23_004225 [Klebsiella pneumoniae]|uniref:hypothetical protein n=1 Tax=Klebsiella pneumoniae TaxID=573 RepID=UPI001CD72779|nr:hypothetical protein [Klebsiella pneumoniae]MCI7953703.1 hypothetical protein [Klebsiella pneumoniae]MDD7878209.1 hypothetical protein [Klebsiella pneumoniae]HBR0796349.1 hypothetical protein [Klebsiella pneumoniae]HBT6212410.1 hypothetical protein [Klebsiella pneumoniae]HCT1855257.1 hypothetical protein [Klebsiella pneumoniae]